MNDLEKVEEILTDVNRISAKINDQIFLHKEANYERKTLVCLYEAIQNLKFDVLTAENRLKNLYSRRAQEGSSVEKEKVVKIIKKF